MIICLQAKIEAHKTKIAYLEAQKEEVSILNETAENKPEINENKNVIGKRTYVRERVVIVESVYRYSSSILEFLLFQWSLKLT